MVTINSKPPISEKRNNKESDKGARLSKKAMLSRDINKVTKPSLNAFRLFELSSRACQGPRNPPIAIFRVHSTNKKNYLPTVYYMFGSWSQHKVILMYENHRRR